MTKLRVAILGASGIGKFHAREFCNAGCEIAAILGSTEQTATQTAKMLSENFGIKTKPYHEIDTLLQSEDLDAVSICTPAKLHAHQVKKSLDADLHVFCEKPFVLDSQFQNYQTAQELITLAEKEHKVLTVNTQWPSVTSYLDKYVDLKNIEQFSIGMETVKYSGADLLSECLPHLNSMLIRLLPNHEAQNISFSSRNEEDIKINFSYSSCKVEFIVKCKREGPTNFYFSINNNLFTRKIGQGYQQQLEHDGATFDIIDPFKTSITKFISASNGKGECLITKNEILLNTKLQDSIIETYLRTQKK